MKALLPAGAAAVTAVAAYGWFEAGWLATRVVEVPIPRLPSELDGMRIGHLSDFHLGPRSRGRLATGRAVDWVAQRRPDLVAITGDLVTHPRGETAFRELLARLERPFVVLGNHDVAITRDPFSRAAELDDLAELAVLLDDAATTVQVRGCAIQVVGADPRHHRSREAQPWRHVDPAVGLRILLCHYPDVGRQLPAGAFHLVLAGHLHAGQITLPLPGRRVALSHPSARLLAGLQRLPDDSVMHVSPGTGTTFVPFRFLARPEATELVLRASA